MRCRIRCCTRRSGADVEVVLKEVSGQVKEVRRLGADVEVMLKEVRQSGADVEVMWKARLVLMMGRFLS